MFFTLLLKVKVIIVINDIKLLSSLFIFSSIIIVVLSLALFLFTRKYSDKKRNLFSVFLDTSIRESILNASNFLNLILILYLVFNIDNFNNLTVMILLVNLVIYLALSLNLYLMFSALIYTGISIALLKILSLIDNYLEFIFFDRNIFYLKVLLIIMIVIFSCFTTIRRLELLLKRSKNRRRENEKD